MQGGGVPEETLKLGLLMEAAHAQQTVAESALESLKLSYPKPTVDASKIKL